MARTYRFKNGKPVAEDVDEDDVDDETGEQSMTDEEDDDADRA